MGIKKFAGGARQASSGLIVLLAVFGLVLIGCSNDGAVGPAGPAGAPGATGAPGAVGPSGAAGVAGSDGANGARGAAGVAGNDGADGAAGTAGVDGDAGAAGASSVVPGTSLAQGKAVKGVLVGSSVFLSVYAANQAGAIGGPGAAGFSAPTPYALGTAVNCGSGTTVIASTAIEGVPAGALARCRLGSAGTTDATGAFALTVPDSQTALKGPLHVEVQNGSMVDEATGATILGPAGVAINTSLRALAAVDFLDDLRQAGGLPDIQKVAVTGLTEFATSLAIGAGSQAPTTVQAHSANTLTGQIFGIGSDVVRTLPSDILDPGSSSDSEDAKSYGLVNAGLSQLAQDLGGDRDVLDVVRVGADDFSNYILDSSGTATAALTVPGPSLTPLPSDAFARQFGTAITTIQASSANQTGFTVSADTIAAINVADFSSNILLTMSNNGIRIADALVPSGSLAHVRPDVLLAGDGLGIQGGVAIMRNAVGAPGAPDAVGRVRVGSGSGFFQSETVFARAILRNYVTSGANDDRGFGSIMVSPRWTMHGVTANDIAQGLAPAGTQIDLRSITVTLSALKLDVTSTGVLPSIPSDAVLHVSGLRDGNGNPLQFPTAIAPGGIISRGFALSPNIVDLLPNGLVRAITGQGFAQFNTLGKNGIFVMELGMGIPILLHASAANTQAETNAPPLTGTASCTGSPALVSAAPLGVADCQLVDEVRFSINVAP